MKKLIFLVFTLLSFSSFASPDPCAQKMLIQFKELMEQENLVPKSFRSANVTEVIRQLDWSNEYDSEMRSRLQRFTDAPESYYFYTGRGDSGWIKVYYSLVAHRQSCKLIASFFATED